MLSAYVFSTFLATVLMATGCWFPALVCLAVGLGIAVRCFVQNRKRGMPYGIERRARPRV